MKDVKLSSLLNGNNCHEVQIHYKRPVFNQLQKISSADDSYQLLRKSIDMNRIDHKEFFWVILLTNANHVLGISEIGAGNSRGVVVHIKEVYQLALLMNASAIIVAHNHPSGKLDPSSQDRAMTQKLKKVSELLDITLLDHLIITSEGFVSFADSNWM